MALDSQVSRFAPWCAQSITSSGDDRSIINAVRTRLRHVKVEQIVVGCHLHEAFDLSLPIDIEFLRFIRGKPEIRPAGNDTPCVSIRQGNRYWSVFDSGKPLDEMDDYACPTYPFMLEPLDQVNRNWRFSIHDIDLLNCAWSAVRLGALIRLYARMAQALGRVAGYDCLINRRMSNVALQPSRSVLATINPRGPIMEYVYGFEGSRVQSTGLGVYHRRFRREFPPSGEV